CVLTAFHPPFRTLPIQWRMRPSYHRPGGWLGASRCFGAPPGARAPARAAGPAASPLLLPGERGVPLPRPVLRRPALRRCRRAGSGVAAHRHGSGRVRPVAATMAACPPVGPERAVAAGPARGGAGRHELAVLSRHRSAATVDRGG